MFWILILLTSNGGAAEGAGDPIEVPGFHGRFFVAADDTRPVISYTLVHHMLAEQDREPLLRIYGSGVARLHIPRYMKQPGDYELVLDRAALGRLLADLVADGVMNYDRENVRREKAALDRQRDGEASLYHVSDLTETVIEIRLDGYQPDPAAPLQREFRRREVWRNLGVEAGRYPEIRAIRGAASAAARLHAFLGRSDLRRVVR